MGNVTFTGGGGVSKMVTGTGISTNFSLADLEGGWSGSANSALRGSITMTISFDASGNVTGGSTSFGAIFTGGTLSINSSTGALSGTIFFNAPGTSGSCTVGSGSQLNAAKTTLTGSVSCTDGDQITSIFLTSQQAKATLTVNIVGSGDGTVTGTGISCRTDCSEVFNIGTSVTLTAASDPGSTFAGFSGGGCSGTGPCTVIVNTNTTVTATYLKIFTDDPLTAGTTIKAVHPNELRQAVDNLRAQGGLGAFLYTNPNLTAGVDVVKAIDFNEIITALTEAATELGQAAPNLTPVAPGDTVRAADIQAIRNAVRAVES